MKKMSAKSQKILKVIHITVAIIWLSNVLLLALLPIVESKITNGGELYMYNLIYHFIDMFVLTPAAIMTLFTGLIYSIFTNWGFFKHGWIVYKWVVTLAIIVAGTFYLGPMVTELLELSDIKRLSSLNDQIYIKGGIIGFWAAVMNSILLFLAVLLSIFKPWKNIK